MTEKNDRYTMELEIEGYMLEQLKLSAELHKKMRDMKLHEGPNKPTSEQVDKYIELNEIARHVDESIGRMTSNQFERLPF